MKLVSGIADAGKIAAVSGDHQSVLVADGVGFVKLTLGANSFPASLTPEQARKIAKDLIASAKRIEVSGP